MLFAQYGRVQQSIMNQGNIKLWVLLNVTSRKKWGQIWKNNFTLFMNAPQASCQLACREWCACIIACTYKYGVNVSKYCSSSGSTSLVACRIAATKSDLKIIYIWQNCRYLPPASTHPSMVKYWMKSLKSFSTIERNLSVLDIYLDYSVRSLTGVQWCDRCLDLISAAQCI